MTNEEHAPEAVNTSGWEAASYMQWGVPGVPFSAVRVPLSHDPAQGAAWIDLGLRASKYLAEHYEKTFPGADVRLGESPTPRREAQRAPQRAQGGDMGVYCPEHNNAPCQLSKPEYNKDGDKFFHALEERDQYRNQRGQTVKSHTLYWRQTVNAQGESNAGKVMPGPGVKPAQDSESWDVGGGDIDPDELPF